MLNSRFLLVASFLLLVVSGARAQESDDADRLFETDEIL